MLPGEPGLLPVGRRNLQRRGKRFSNRHDLRVEAADRRPVSRRVRGASQPELGEPLDAPEDDRPVLLIVTIGAASCLAGVVVRRDDDDEAAVQNLADVPWEHGLDEPAEAQPALERAVGRAPPGDHLQQDDAVAVAPSGADPDALPRGPLRPLHKSKPDDLASLQGSMQFIL